MLKIIECIGADIFNEQFADSPQLVVFLKANFDGIENTQARRQLLEFADESGFSLHQWVESLSIVKKWLDVRGLVLAMIEQIGYVCCAVEAAEAGASLTHLPSLVAEMLEAHGCERATETVNE